MTKLERSARQNIRAAVMDNGQPGVTLRVITYGGPDSYGSVWAPGCLTEGFSQRKPQLAFSHSWAEPIGRATAFRDSDDGPEMDFYFDDFEDVPVARRVYRQIQSGTLTDCSVGFGWDYEYRDPTEDDLKRWPGAKEVITKAQVDEVSIVLRGAVEGATVLSLRSKPTAIRPTKRSMVIDAEAAAQLMIQLKAGSISTLEALQIVESQSVAAPEPTKEELEPSEEPETAEGEQQSEPEIEQPSEAELPSEADTPEEAQESEQGQVEEETLDEQPADSDAELLSDFDNVLTGAGY